MAQHPTRFRRSAVAFGLFLSVTGCSDAEVARARPAAPARIAVRTVPCADDAVSRSVCMIRMILEDVQREKGGISGGGIADVIAVSSTSYRVALPREEAVDLYTYRFEVAAGSVTLRERTVATGTVE